MRGLLELRWQQESDPLVPVAGFALAAVVAVLPGDPLVPEPQVGQPLLHRPEGLLLLGRSEVVLLCLPAQCLPNLLVRQLFLFPGRSFQAAGPFLTCFRLFPYLFRSSKPVLALLEQSHP